MQLKFSGMNYLEEENDFGNQLYVLRDYISIILRKQTNDSSMEIDKLFCGVQQRKYYVRWKIGSENSWLVLVY